MIGLNKDILVQYVEYITNDRMQAVGLPLPASSTFKPNSLDKRLVSIG